MTSVTIAMIRTLSMQQLELNLVC